MDIIAGIIDFIIHIDQHLVQITTHYGTWTYLVLFLIVFAETGLVVTPFLPGDSLLFAAGALCSLGTIDLTTLMSLLVVAAILGDGVNYHVGQFVGPRVFRNGSRWWLNTKHLAYTQSFYAKHGGKTIIIARFMPIVRTFAPFVAGIGSMAYKRFLAFNVIGAIVWVCSLSILGFAFGNHPLVKENFSLVILMIIFLSILPGIIEYIRHKLRSS